MRLSGAVLSVLLVLPCGARGGDYPTDPEEQDKLCEAIGETPNVAVGPHDRLWMKENCVCVAEMCGKLTSERFSVRLRETTQRLRAQLDVAQGQPAAIPVVSKQEVPKAAQDCIDSQAGTITPPTTAAVGSRTYTRESSDRTDELHAVESWCLEGIKQAEVAERLKAMQADRAERWKAAGY